MSKGGAVLAVLIAVLALPAMAEGALRFRPCERTACARLAVPLDRSGAQQGRISLYVERLRHFREPRRGVAVLLAGGPGQAATRAFEGLFPDEDYEQFAGLMPHHDIVAFDPRGTGRSGLLRCRELERANLIDAGREAALCAQRLGARRAFYRTPDTVEDLEAVRVALGAERLTLVGVSYGTLVAQAYAASHPDRVERLLLDSVLDVDGWDPFYRDIFGAVPRVLAAVCRPGCRRFTDDPVEDVARLVRRLGRGPLGGRVTLPDGRRARSSLTRPDLFFTLVAGDVDPISRATFPAAVISALRGDSAPILRLKRRAVLGGVVRPRELSAAAYAATSCEDIPFPWPRFSEPAARFGPILAAAEAIPPEALHPFDAATTAGNDFIRMCRRWPEASPGPLTAPPPGSLPDVPVLMLEGGQDLRTPVEGARRAAAVWPDAQVVVVPATGHSVFGNDLSGCAYRAASRFFRNSAVPLRCPPGRAFYPVRDPLPASLGELPGDGGLSARVARAAQLTILDVYEDFGSDIFSGRGADRGAGLRGGRWWFTRRGSIRIKRAELVPGVRLSGEIDDSNRGRLRVEGPGRIDGVLRLNAKTLTGRLGGRPVRVSSGLRVTAAATRRPRPALLVP